MKQVYQAFDGEVFNTKDECVKHEFYVANNKNMLTFVCEEDIIHPRPFAGYEDIVNNAGCIVLRGTKEEKESILSDLFDVSRLFVDELIKVNSDGDQFIYFHPDFEGWIDIEQYIKREENEIEHMRNLITSIKKAMGLPFIN